MESGKQNVEISWALQRLSIPTISFGEFSVELRGNKEVVMAAVRKNGQNLEYVSEELRADREIVLEAVKNDKAMPFMESPVRYASLDLLDDEEVALAAVRAKGIALEHLSDRLKNDFNIAALAVETDLDSFKFASRKLRADKEFVKLGLRMSIKHKRGLSALTVTMPSKVMSKKLKGDAEFILENFPPEVPLLFSGVSKQLLASKDFAIRLVKLCSLAYIWLPEQLRANKEVIALAVGGLERVHASKIPVKVFEGDKDFFYECCKANSVVFDAVKKHSSMVSMFDSVEDFIRSVESLRQKTGLDSSLGSGETKIKRVKI